MARSVGSLLGDTEFTSDQKVVIYIALLEGGGNKGEGNSTLLHCLDKPKNSKCPRSCEQEENLKDQGLWGF